MAVKFSDLILVSDIDGTLLETSDYIPTRNIDALQRFVRKGGRFAVATGRSISSAQQFVPHLPINMPCILYNGCCIYDYASEKIMYGSYLPESYKTYSRIILDRFPDIGFALMDEKIMYSVSAPYYTIKHLGNEKMLLHECALDAVKSRCFKVVMSVDEEYVPEVVAFVTSQNWQDVAFVRSGIPFIEMLPVNINKGSGLCHLAHILNVPIARTAAIGDFYNDVDMLKTAGIAATVKIAPDGIKDLCTFIAGDCGSGAVADFIEYLETIAE